MLVIVSVCVCVSVHTQSILCGGKRTVSEIWLSLLQYVDP